MRNDYEVKSTVGYEKSITLRLPVWQVCELIKIQKQTKYINIFPRLLLSNRKSEICNTQIFKLQQCNSTSSGTRLLTAEKIIVRNICFILLYFPTFKKINTRFSEAKNKIKFKNNFVLRQVFR